MPVVYTMWTVQVPSNVHTWRRGKGRRPGEYIDMTKGKGMVGHVYVAIYSYVG